MCVWVLAMIRRYSERCCCFFPLHSPYAHTFHTHSIASWIILRIQWKKNSQQAHRTHRRDVRFFLLLKLKTVCCILFFLVHFFGLRQTNIFIFLKIMMLFYMLSVYHNDGKRRICQVSRYSFHFIWIFFRFIFICSLRCL